MKFRITTGVNTEWGRKKLHFEGKRQKDNREAQRVCRAKMISLLSQEPLLCRLFIWTSQERVQ